MMDDLTTNDLQLSAGDIGVLEDGEQVVHLFARLRYDVDDSIPLDHSALGLDTTDLRHQIRAIRRIGEDPVDGDIVIYLLEVRSVTVSLTQQIARRFRERTEFPLLVLTSDYERLDFVLVDRELATGKRLTQRFDITFPTARLALSRLEEIDIVNEYTGKKRNQRFVASEIMDILTL